MQVGQIVAGGDFKHSLWGRGIMRTASLMAGVLLAIFIAAPGSAAPDRQTDGAIATKKRAVQSAKPTWEQCFDMSINRGFNHDTEEWQQSIQDCLAGKIPL